MFNYDILVNCIMWDTSRTDHIIYNEYGTRYMEAEPAIKPAFDKAVQNVKRELNNLTK